MVYGVDMETDPITGMLSLAALAEMWPNDLVIAVEGYSAQSFGPVSPNAVRVLHDGKTYRLSEVETVDTAGVDPGPPSVMDLPGYWEFVEATPPFGNYGYEVLSGDERLFMVAVFAETSEEAEMRAVQVAKYLGEDESISVGVSFLNNVAGKRWAVTIEAW